MKSRILIFLLFLFGAIVPNAMATECGNVATIQTGSVGQGYESYPDPEETPNPGLSDFITPKAWVALNSDGSGEQYQYAVGQQAYACSNTKNVGDADSPSDIKVMFLRSDGYKEDAHSEWEQVGSLENIRDYNMEVGEEKQECTGFNVPSVPGVYNIVACPDRTVTNDNGDGDVAEIHKSNNCSTEAVFYVTKEQTVPSTRDSVSPAIINFILSD